MIDLHSHTDESDGTASPLELVELALARGVEALAISDHDTFAGYDQALPEARKRGLDLVCGIELSTRVPGGKCAPFICWDIFCIRLQPRNFVPGSTS